MTNSHLKPFDLEKLLSVKFVENAIVLEKNYQIIL